MSAWSSDRGDESGLAAHWGGLFLRPHSDGTVGRVHHRALRKRRVCRDARRHRFFHRLLHGRHLVCGVPGLNCVAAALVDRDLCHISCAQHFRRGSVIPRHADRDAAVAGSAGHFLGQRDSEHGFQPLGAQHRRGSGWRGYRASGRQRRHVPVRFLRRFGDTAVCRVAVPGDRTTAACGRRVGRSQARHAARYHCSACSP